MKFPEDFECESIEIFKYKAAAIDKKGKLFCWGKFKDENELTRLPE
jgi:hypothetical protein